MSPEIQVDAWAAMVHDRGVLEQPLKSGVKEDVRERNLPNLEIYEGAMSMASGILDKFISPGDPSEYTFFNQNVGGSAEANLALRIAKYGNKDLDISWRLLESDPMKDLFGGMTQGTLVVVGIIVFLAGAITSMFGFGFCVMPIGIYIAGAGLGWWQLTFGKSQLTPEQKLKARMLAQTVHHCLMNQLEKLGITRDELIVIEAAQMEGIGEL